MSKLNPTHITWKNSAGKNEYAELKSNTTWTAAKATAVAFSVPATPVRR